MICIEAPIGGAEALNLDILFRTNPKAFIIKT